MIPHSDFDPELDLRMVRTVEARPSQIWQAWTTPNHLMQWFCPKPWTTIACEMDVRPGGRFHTVMRSPEGEMFPNNGCILEAVENQRLVWTSVLHSGFRPVHPKNSAEDLAFTAFILLETKDKGTLYTAVARHSNPEDRQKHAAMGFEKGWSICLDQLLASL